MFEKDKKMQKNVPIKVKSDCVQTVSVALVLRHKKQLIDSSFDLLIKLYSQLFSSAFAKVCATIIKQDITI